MQDLIKLIEAADGPSRELDAEIAKFLGADHGPYEDVCIDRRCVEYYDEVALHYTSSIDAAMTLVPEGCGWNMAHWGVFRLWRGNDGLDTTAKAQSPALAICVAALRARQEV